MGEIMEDYFFVIDSDNLGYVNTRLYGYGLDNDGLILESKKNYDRLSGIGAYVFVNVEMILFHCIRIIWDPSGYMFMQMMIILLYPIPF